MLPFGWTAGTSSGPACLMQYVESLSMQTLRPQMPISKAELLGSLMHPSCWVKRSSLMESSSQVIDTSESMEYHGCLAKVRATKMRVADTCLISAEANIPEPINP